MLTRSNQISNTKIINTTLLENFWPTEENMKSLEAKSEKGATQ